MQLYVIVKGSTQYSSSCQMMRLRMILSSSQGHYLSPPHHTLLLQVSQTSIMLNSYEVPIIPNDLRQEETMVHIIGALNQLTKISTDIFAKIGSKCDEFQGKIASINQRVPILRGRARVFSGSRCCT